jgi:hypothetical protein
VGDAAAFRHDLELLEDSGTTARVLAKLRTPPP